jgi:hypothetical protein
MTTIQFWAPEADSAAYREFWGIGPIKFTPITLPEGIHWLSPESEETLRRAKEKAKAAEARHTKRGA